MGERHPLLGQVYIHDCWPPDGCGEFVKLEAGAGDVALMNNNLSRARSAVGFAPGVGRKQLFESGNRPPRR